MGRLDWLNFKRFLRDRDQLTVELAEQGVASEDEREWTEEQVAKHRHKHDQPDTAAEDE